MTPEQQALFDGHRDLAERVARSVANRHGFLNGLDLADYLQVATVGLWDAVLAYRPELGRFTSYAWRRMHGRVLDEIRDADEVGRSRRARGVRGPTVSLDHPLFGSDGDRMLAVRDLVASSVLSQRREGLEAMDLMLRGLDQVARVVVYLTQVLGLEQVEVAHVVGLTESRVSQILSASMHWLRETKSMLAAGPANEGSHHGKRYGRSEGRPSGGEGAGTAAACGQRATGDSGDAGAVGGCDWSLFERAGSDGA